jgi:hypothetical protein
MQKQEIQAILAANPEIDVKRVRRAIATLKRLRATGALGSKNRGYNLAPPFSRGAVPEGEHGNERRPARLRQER